MELKNSKKEEIKKFAKPFLLVFLISFLIINWNDVSWLFNYKIFSQFFSNLFPKENISALSNNFQETEIKLREFDYSEEENSLEIPELEVLAPLIIIEDSEEENIENWLTKGVVHFPDSALPGQVGHTIILGHSAPPNWPEINYDGVFSQLNNLEEGDKIFVHFNHLKYPYYVTKKTFLDKGEEIPKERLTNSENILILVSCWPPGKDLNRIAIEAELII
jgi:LPXTG-site transpeptidase (sortase) family protein